jgi:hypothetical protein
MGFSYEAHEPLGKLSNPLGLPVFNCIGWYQFRANSNCRSASQNEFPRRMLTDPTCCDQRNLWQRSVQRLDVGFSSHLGTRKHFHKVRSSFPGCDHFGRVSAPGRAAISFFAAKSTTCGLKPVLVMKLAPARRSGCYSSPVARRALAHPSNRVGRLPSASCCSAGTAIVKLHRDFRS